MSQLTLQDDRQRDQFCLAHVMAGTYTLLELGALEVLLHLEAGEVSGLASVLLKVLPVFSLLALPQLESKLQLQGGREGSQHGGV